ncbi:unnamed protein product [Candidula unifasciata]|uniref:Uncharacterized protein n=1 Tax=Candidula unifasciata TaxID=100452 RepID=A0A8S3YMF6_9EUPU|nr:unnamed protein product [Candidula unifasciata]
MTLRDTVSKWHAAMCLLDENRFNEAAHKLLEIQNPSARIFYNLGLLCMLQHRYIDAIQYFNRSIDQDKYLALAFYQRGICYYEIQRFDAAVSDFLSARSMILNDCIDYKQLGAEIVLSSQLLDHCVTVTEECLGKKKYGRLLVLPVRDCVLRPQQVLVDNLNKQTFLGNAKIPLTSYLPIIRLFIKVISSAKVEDIMPALEARKAHDPGVIFMLVTKWTSASVPSSPATSRHGFSTSSANRICIPPPPKRPPPRLPSGAVISQQLRLKCKSLEDMTLNYAVNQSAIVEKSKMGQIVSPKPKPDVFKMTSSVADAVTPTQGPDVSAHLHSDDPDRVINKHLLNSSAVRDHVTDILSSQLNASDMQAPPRSVLNHAQRSAVLGQNEGENMGFVSDGHAAKMKLLFERREKQEVMFSQKGVRLDNEKCRLDSESQETSINSQKKRLDIMQQSKPGDLQQNITNVHQCLSSLSLTAFNSNIQKSPRPVRPPPPKSSK